MQAQIEDFLNFITIEKGYSKHTIAAYRSDLTQLLAYLTDEGISSWREIGRDCLLEYIFYLKELEYASSTVARKTATLKSFFHFLMIDEVLQDNVADTVDCPSVARHLPHPLSPDEVARLLRAPLKSDMPKALQLRDWALLELMYATGMRASEIVGLDEDSVDLEDKTARCLGKGNKERILPLYERAKGVLNAYIEIGRPTLLQEPEEKALFVNQWGRRLTRQGLWLIIKKQSIAANIEHNVTPHTLRHTFATHLLDGGAGLREVQQLLGHTNIVSTQIYTKVSTRRKRESYDKAHPRA